MGNFPALSMVILLSPKMLSLKKVARCCALCLNPGLEMFYTMMAWDGKPIHTLGKPSLVRGSCCYEL